MNKSLFLIFALFFAMNEAKQFRISHDLNLDPTHHVNYSDGNSLHSVDDQQSLNPPCQPVEECEYTDLAEGGKQKTCKTVYKC